jgi:hypothetical protein
LANLPGWEENAYTLSLADQLARSRLGYERDLGELVALSGLLPGLLLEYMERTQDEAVRRALAEGEDEHEG